MDLFRTTVREALAKREMLKELAALRQERSLDTRAPVKIIGQSEGIRKVLQSVEEVADIPTNTDLEEAIAGGRFRQDLFYRLNVYTIEIPPLRDRKEDIPLLAEFYLRRFCDAYRRSISGLSTSAMLCLREYHRPGNVRELTLMLNKYSWKLCELSYVSEG